MVINWKEGYGYEKYATDWQHLEDIYEERSAILEYDAGYERYDAEQFSAQAMGFDNKAHFKSYIQYLKAEGDLI